MSASATEDVPTPAPRADDTPVTASQAQRLIASMPSRPQRSLTASDHASAAATIALSFAAGLLALSGSPWWAILPGLAAVVIAHVWLDKRQRRANEPRLRAASIVAVVFSVWLLIPIWRGITRGEMIPLPEALLFAGLAPAAWLVFYCVLLIRR